MKGEACNAESRYGRNRRKHCRAAEEKQSIGQKTAGAYGSDTADDLQVAERGVSAHGGQPGDPRRSVQCHSQRYPRCHQIVPKGTFFRNRPKVRQPALNQQMSVRIILPEPVCGCWCKSSTRRCGRRGNGALPLHPPMDL